MTTWLNKQISINMRSIQLELVDEAVKNNPGKYKDRSHFIRCALIKLLKEEGYSTN